MQHHHWQHLVIGLAAVAALGGCDKTTTVTQTPSGAVSSTTVSPSADASAAIGKIDASLAAAASAVQSSAAASQALTKLGDAIADSAVTAQVKAAMLTDPDLKGTHIEVETKAGVVTLRGTVASVAGRSRAEHVAQETRGVRSVDSQLVVQAPS
ncbi:MAG: BON domain-containing protein [Pseudomonadota bacterium]|nr:BON domain-containing protein [Pseudomonadota bacterium]